MTIFNNIVLATADALPVIAATPAYRLANDLMFGAKESIFTALSAQSESNEPGNSFRRIGYQKPHSAVFLRLKIKVMFNRFRSMAVLLGSFRAGRFPIRDFSRLFNTVAHVLENKSVGLSSELETAMNTTSMGTNPPELSNQTQLEEFKDAAIALCGGNAFLFLPIPSPTALSQIIVKCERLLIAAKSLQTEGGVA